MAEHATFHEPIELLSQAIMERHRAIVSLMEELEAVDWYDQRVEATTDDSIRSVMAHNRDEEKEHAAMTLEWLRRHDAEVGRGAAHVPLHRGPDRRGRTRSRTRMTAAGSPPTAHSESAICEGNRPDEPPAPRAAPVPPAAWEQIEEEASRTLRHFLTRPAGWST